MALIRISSAEVWKCSHWVLKRLCQELNHGSTHQTVRERLNVVERSGLAWCSLIDLHPDAFRSLLTAVVVIKQQHADTGPRNLAELDSYTAYLDRLNALTHTLRNDARASVQKG